MEVIDEKLLEQFRRKPRCEMCARKSRNGLHPHHLWSRGQGGGSRVDIPENLLALCASCHDDVHMGRVTRAFVLALVAQRERKTVEEITRIVTTVRNAPNRRPHDGQV